MIQNVLDTDISPVTNRDCKIWGCSKFHIIPINVEVSSSEVPGLSVGFGDTELYRNIQLISCQVIPVLHGLITEFRTLSFHTHSH